ncbi:hypothetical protein Q9966_013954 [Columba livia]|nr:hypothetical protein Q9966_013954 [Columba livia]
MEAEPVGHNPPRRRRGRASAGARASRSPPADSTPGAAASCSRVLPVQLGVSQSLEMLEMSEVSHKEGEHICQYIFYFNFCISFKPGIICGVVLKKQQETGGFWYPLRRGSSFTFLTPGSHWDFTLKRKRREKEDDVVSLCSLDFKNTALNLAPNINIWEWNVKHSSRTVNNLV